MKRPFSYSIYLLGFLIPFILSCSSPSKAVASDSEPRVVQKTMPDDYFQGKLEPKNKHVLIAIDAGHGGRDTGALAQGGRVKEKHLTLDTARYVKQYLNKMGYRCLMIRSKDAFIPLPDRSRIANERRATIFVSIHFNSAPNTSASGIEVYHFAPVKEKSGDSKKLATSCLDNIVHYTGGKGRGVKGATFSVLRLTKMPAILVEGGFMTNSQELSCLKNKIYLKRLGWGIAKGVDSYLKNKH